jgi:hypothetical protein
VISLAQSLLGSPPYLEKRRFHVEHHPIQITPAHRRTSAYQGKAFRIHYLYRKQPGQLRGARNRLSIQTKLLLAGPGPAKTQCVVSSIRASHLGKDKRFILPMANQRLQAAASE